MAARVPPKAMAKKLVRVLRPQPPDAYYLKKVSHHTRELLNVGAAPKATRLPELLTDAELMAFYEAVWGARQLTHVVMLKLLLFTGTRNAELVHLRPPMSICRPAGCGLSRAKAVRIAMSSSP